MDELLDDAPQEEPEALDLDRLSACARAVLDIAAFEAKRWGDPFIGTDHALIGLARAEQGVAASILANLDLSAETLIERMTFIRGIEAAGSDGAAEPQLSPRLVSVLTLAAKDATKRNLVEIGTLSLLTGLLREKAGLCIAVLEAPGVGLERVSRAITDAHRNGLKDG